MRVGIKFARDDRAKYVAHLDMQRCIQRMLVRSGLSCEYSSGFNPHITLSFASPLPVGVATKGDYFEFVLTDRLDLKTVLQALCCVCPPGITILAAFELFGKKLMASVAYATYELSSCSDFKKLVDSLRSPQLMITNKKGNSFDAIPLIHAWTELNERIIITVHFSSAKTLNPADILKALGQEASIERLDLLNEKLLPLMDQEV